MTASRTGSSSPIRRTPSIDCSKVKATFVLIHDQHGHGEDEKLGCTGWLDSLGEDASHGGYIAGGISVTYTDNGGAGATPPLTTIKQHVVQIRRQQAEYVQQESGTTVAGGPGGRDRPGRRTGPLEPRSG